MCVCLVFKKMLLKQRNSYRGFFTVRAALLHIKFPDNISVFYRHCCLIQIGKNTEKNNHVYVDSDNYPLLSLSLVIKNKGAMLFLLLSLLNLSPVLAKHFVNHWTDFYETLRVMFGCTSATDSGVNPFMMTATAL